jgi:glyoxylase-like metal-dependent hydrolase (beta-lactamase superfamily II)
VVKIHHLNCGSMCPVVGHVLPGMYAKKIVCHCLLIEDQQRLILVDTGLGTRDMRDRSRLGLLAWELRPVLDPEQTALAQIKALGYSPSDVTDIIPTHLDLDHAGGIQDFPQARVHVSHTELRVARAQASLVDRTRYRECQLSGDIKWQEYDLSQGEKWRNFDCVRSIEGLPPEVLLVSLPGHTAGHFGVALEQGSKWLLHAGDSYYDHKELGAKSKYPWALKLVQKSVHDDYALAVQTQIELGRLKADPALEIFSSHDVEEFAQALANRC